ncbi:MAG: sugar ABC transporter permease, partial [Solirubrobacterales bacterium]|nr:sugar ABC transporter permease [Solirubrobacterales bacterium]
MLIPGVIAVFIFCYVPMGGVIIAFQRFIPARGLFGEQQWVGLKNFRTLFKLPGTSLVLRNTLTIASMKIALGILVPVSA